ncbi:MAG: hypothetical protein ACOZQL_05505 [Myxococcota bacterium]
MRLAVLTVALLSACGPTVIDLRFTSSPPATLRALEVQLSGGANHLERIAPDAGVTLPASLRLVVDAETSALGVTASGFDTDGAFRSASLELSPRRGGALSQDVDLSSRAWCPAAPPADGDFVVFDDQFRNGSSGFGYAASNWSVPRDGALACSGDGVIQYQLRHVYDGIGIDLPRNLAIKRYSLRIYVESDCEWAWAFNAIGSSMQYFVPMNGTVSLKRGWQRVVLEVPDSVPPVGGVQCNVQQTGSLTFPSMVRFDDIRIELR